MFSVVAKPVLCKLPVRSADQKLAKGEVCARFPKERGRCGDALMSLIQKLPRTLSVEKPLHHPHYRSPRKVPFLGNMDLPKVSVFFAGQAFSLIQHRVTLGFSIQRMRSEWPTAELVQLPVPPKWWRRRPTLAHTEIRDLRLEHLHAHLARRIGHVDCAHPLDRQRILGVGDLIRLVLRFAQLPIRQARCPRPR